jgi:hypothetical protein
MRPRLAVLGIALVTIVTLAACGGPSSAPPSTTPTTAASPILNVTNAVEGAMAPICDVERLAGKSSGRGSQEEIQLLLGRGDCSMHPEGVDTRVVIDSYADANAALTGATANLDPSVERVSRPSMPSCHGWARRSIRASSCGSRARRRSRISPTSEAPKSDEAPRWRSEGFVIPQL